MSKAWASVPLSEIAKPVLRPVAVVPGESYRTIGVKWWGQGAYERETIDGASTAAKTLSIVRQGDLIINKIWVRHGSTAIATDAVDGCAASGEFPTFELDNAKVLPRWLHWQTKTREFWAKCDSLSRGTSGKNRIKPELFLTVTIPLPPLAEQQRIVARIEQLAAKIEMVQEIWRQSSAEQSLLMSRALAAMLDGGGWKVKPLEEVLAEPPRNGLAPQPEADNGRRRMLRISAVSSSPTRYVDLEAYKLVDVDDSTATPFVLRHDDVFIVRYNGDMDRLAKAAIFKDTDNTGIVYPDKLMRLRPHTHRMTSDFLVYALSAPSVRGQVEALGKTTAGQIGISGRNVKSFRVAVPPLDEQRRIVAHLDGIQAKVTGLKQLQAQTAVELDALLPSILDKAFKGEF